MLLSTDMFTLIDEDAIVPFDDVATGAEDKAWLAGFYPGFMENSQTGGKTWGIPFQRSTIVLYWNKDVFKEAGLDPNKPPRDLGGAGRDGQEADQEGRAGNVDAVGRSDPVLGLPLLAVPGAGHAERRAADERRPATETYFDKPAVVEALQYWVDLAASTGSMPPGIVEWGTLRAGLLRAQGRDDVAHHRQPHHVQAERQVRVRRGHAARRTSGRASPTGGGNFYIFKKATPDEREAAVTFVKWMTAPERAAAVGHRDRLCRGHARQPTRPRR